jgi:chromosome segregation ATPase
MPDVDCDKLQKDLDAAAGKAKEALNELYDRAGELSRASDEIRTAHAFDPGDMTDKEVVDAQLDLIEHDRETTESKIKDLEQDWHDAGAGKQSDIKLTIALEKRLKQLDRYRDRLNTIDDGFDQASDKFDDAEGKKDDKLKDWSEHCEDDPPVDDDDDENGDDRPTRTATSSRMRSTPRPQR